MAGRKDVVDLGFRDGRVAGGSRRIGGMGWGPGGKLLGG